MSLQQCLALPAFAGIGVIFGVIGIVIPIVIWMLFHEKSSPRSKKTFGTVVIILIGICLVSLVLITCPPNQTSANPIGNYIKLPTLTLLPNSRPTLPDPCANIAFDECKTKTP